MNFGFCETDSINYKKNFDKSQKTLTSALSVTPQSSSMSIQRCLTQQCQLHRGGFCTFEYLHEIETICKNSSTYKHGAQMG